jgi:hypothetical protein
MEPDGAEVSVLCCVFFSCNYASSFDLIIYELYPANPGNGQLAS